MVLTSMQRIPIEGKTPLYWLLEFHEGDKLPMAKFLLENGADVNAISNIGDTPLKRALVCNCGADVVGLLVDHGADTCPCPRQCRHVLDKALWYTLWIETVYLIQVPTKKNTASGPSV
jgi:ankyrin repeat protein